MSIQLFLPSYRTDECLEAIRQCLDIGWTGLGYKTIEFENQWKKYTGFKNAHFLNSATAGLHLAVKILKEHYNWHDDDEIISTPLTFISTNHAICYEKLKVVFADVDDYLCLDPEDVENKITSKTRAVMFVGIGGNTGQYLDIVALCKKYHLKLILDASHMAGTRLNGIIPGKEADAVIYSFQAVKNLPTADSGMLCFSLKELDSLSRKYSWLGINKDTYTRSNHSNYKWMYDVEHLGYKYHGNSIMAAIGLVQLKYLDSDNQYRKDISDWYDKIFKNSTNKINPIPIAKDCAPSRHLYIIEVNNRDEIMEILNQNKIYPGVHYRDNTEYKMYIYAQNTCPTAHIKSNRIISLPIHLGITQNDVENISKIIIDHVK